MSQALLNDLVESSKKMEVTSRELLKRSRELLAISKLSTRESKFRIHEYRLRQLVRRVGNHPLKVCGACRKAYTFPLWQKAVFIGYQEGPLSGEFRNCIGCNSTLFLVTFRDAKK